MQYEIYYPSEKRDGKLKNGDSFNYSELVEEKLAILCVSDGVGSLQRDWLASETTCKVFVDKFIEHVGSIESRMKNAVLTAHNEVVTLSNQYNMAATFVAVIVDFNLNMIYYLSIGDSRIFIRDNEKPKLITKDDTTSRIVKMNDKIFIKEGSPFIEHFITKAIGQCEKLEFEINSIPFNAGETVILATDGIHNHGDLPQDISDFINQKNISTKLQSAVSECSLENNDDATILILRRNDFPSGSKSLYIDAILKNLDLKSEKLYGHLLTDCAVEVINQSIEDYEFEKVKKCLNYLNDKRLFLTKETLIEWLNLVLTKSTNDGHLISLLRKLIQISN